MDFSNVFRESVLDGLKNVIGESGMKIVVLRLQLAQDKEDAAEVHSKLFSMFSEGAVVLEKQIVKELCRKLNVPYEERGSFDFKTYVSEAREGFLSKQMRG